MKSKKQKRIEAMKRAESYSFENSKQKRRDNSEASYNKWIETQISIREFTEKKGV